MRWFRLFLAALFIGVSLAAVLQGSSPAKSSPLSLLENLLRSQNEEIRQRIEERFRTSENLSQEIVTRWRRHDYTYQSLLNSDNGPKLVWFEGKRVRASDFHYEDEWIDTIAEFTEHGNEPYALKEFENNYYLLTRSYFQGKPFSALYPLHDFFRFLGMGNSVQNWLVNAEGRVLFHTNSKLLGEVLDNIRPVAEGSSELGRSGEFELFTKFVSTDGREVWGAWTTIPALRLVAITEWRGAAVTGETESPFNKWLILSAGVLGLALLLSFFWGNNGSHLSTGGEIHDGQSLLLQQVEVMRSERDGALEQLSRVKHSAEFDALWDELLQMQDGQELWTHFLRHLEQLRSDSVVVFYRFSQASCSLIPAEVLGLQSYDPVVQRFWKDTRIFIGKVAALETLLATEAFKKWNSTRQRFMGVRDDAFLALPVQQTRALRGIICVYFPQAPEPAWLDEYGAKLKKLVNRVAYLYEPKQRLVELKDAKQVRRHGVEGAENLPRSESQPS